MAGPVTRQAVPDTGFFTGRSCQMVKRIGAALLWPLALAFLFIGFNKNDPYLISLRGAGNIAVAAVGIAVAIVLIRRGYWNGAAKTILLLLWCVVPVSVFAAHLRFEWRKHEVLHTETSAAHKLGQHRAADGLGLLADLGGAGPGVDGAIGDVVGPGPVGDAAATGEVQGELVEGRPRRIISVCGQGSAGERLKCEINPVVRAQRKAYTRFALANVRHPLLQVQFSQYRDDGGNQRLAYDKVGPASIIEKETDRDRYFSAIEAKEFGLVDEVIEKIPEEKKK